MDVVLHDALALVGGDAGLGGHATDPRIGGRAIALFDGVHGEAGEGEGVVGFGAEGAFELDHGFGFALLADEEDGELDVGFGFGGAVVDGGAEVGDGGLDAAGVLVAAGAHHVEAGGVGAVGEALFEGAVGAGVVAEGGVEAAEV
jgi:hypothetical protein